MRFLTHLARNPMALSGVLLLALLVTAALTAPLMFGEPGAYDLSQRLLPPSLESPFGTDRMGSDLLAGVLYGARATLLIATTTAAVGVLVGVPVGLLAGYYRNPASDALMRMSDVALALPQIVIAIAITQTLGPSLKSVIIAISLTYWPFWSRLVYAETRSMRNEIFIEATLALGASPWRVMVLHILPAIASSIVVRTSIGVGATILSAVTLGFLGLGAPPPTPEWGRMIAESREYLPEAWWYPLAPGLAIFLTVLSVYLIGDGVRDLRDPRAKHPR